MANKTPNKTVEPTVASRLRPLAILSSLRSSSAAHRWRWAPLVWPFETAEDE